MNRFILASQADRPSFRPFTPIVFLILLYVLGDPLSCFQNPCQGWARQKGPWKVWPPSEARITEVKKDFCFLDKGWAARFVEGIELGIYRGEWLINIGKVAWSGEGRCRVVFSLDLMIPAPGDRAALPTVSLDLARSSREYLDEGLTGLRKGAYNHALASLFHAHILDSRCRGAQFALGFLFRRYGEWDISIIWSARAAGLDDSTARAILSAENRQARNGNVPKSPGNYTNSFKIENSPLRGHAMVTGKPVLNLVMPGSGRMSPGSDDSPMGHDGTGSAERLGSLVNIGLCLIEKNDPVGALHVFLAVCKEYPEDMKTRAMAWLGSGIAGRMILDRGEAWGARYADAGLAGFRRAWKGRLEWLGEAIPKGTRGRAILDSGFFRDL